MFPHRLPRRRGAGLFSLLVLLAILALGAALLLPAIQKVREAANKMRCANNLRQIGIAAHNYHNDFSKLPPGCYGPVRANGGMTDVAPEKSKDRGPWTSCFTALLPYMEQDNLYKMLWSPQRTFPPPADGPMQGRMCGVGEEREAWWSVQQNLGLAGTRLAVLKCPSDKVDEATSAGVLYTVHVANHKFQNALGPATLGRSNYAGVAGADGDFDPPGNRMFGNPPADFRQWIGIMYNRSTLTLGQITVQDGTSNTLLFGESLGGSGVGPRDRAWSWLGVGAMGTAFGLGRANVPAPAEPPTLGVPAPTGKDGAAWYRFSSRHNVVQFCFGDVSVRGARFGKTTIPDTSGNPAGNNHSDWALLQQLAGRKDGFNNDVSSILE
jgi:hypothetical protein